ncbi:sulfatase family protein [Halocatena marina]|uniref:sulfatase family protein n=1 Tax=Halocatena marina TaxID=2934937 RepID=UPI00200DA7A9|nr:sulfatase [Halocatena marina]
MVETPNGNDNRPNVLLVHCHDLGRNLGCYDRGVETPNIDELAADGVLMENQFCTAPQCCPSRGSLMTGRYPHNNGLMGQVTWGWELPESETTLPEHLAQIGYSTHLFGFQHVKKDDESIYGRVHTTDSRASNVSETFSEDVESLTDNGPFFASLSIDEPHLPIRRDHVDDAAYERYHPEDVEVPPYLPDRPGVREQVADLNGVLNHTLDPAVGSICRSVEKVGIAEETLVVFTTDHGLALPRAKGTCYDPGLEVAFIARLPKVFDGGERYDELLSHVDVLPTVLELLGVEVPANVDGRSFLPMVTGNDYEERDHVYAEMTWHERYVPMRTIRTKRFKYVRNFWKQQRVHLPADILGSRAGREVCEEFYTTERPREELYDLREDPHEQENLASGRGALSPPDSSGLFGAPGAGPDPDSDYTEDVRDLRQRIHDWMQATDDPLLDGPVTRPGTEVWEAQELR